MFGLCIYGLRRTATEAVGITQLLAEYLELRSHHMVLKRNNKRSQTRIMISKPNSMPDLRLPASNYSIHASENESGDEVIENSGAYISYFTNEVFSSLIAYSDRVDLEFFLNYAPFSTLMRNSRAKYGFAIDWQEKSSFWAYAAGFQDLASLGGNLLNETPAGRWGVALRRSPDALLDGNFRDIYPVNFLTDMHLSRSTPSGEVRNLIFDGGSEWGQISEICSDWYKWIVRKENIDVIRRRFLSAGLLEPNFL